MKYRDSNDELLMVEQEFGNETADYDESEDMFSETGFIDDDINNFDSELKLGFLFN